MVRETEVDIDKRRIRETRALDRERDRQVRIRSVANDTRLNLPVSPPMPDGEEFPRTSPMQLRSYDQRSEIVKGYIQVPPNRTICNSTTWEAGGGESGGCKICQYSQGASDSKSNSTGQLNSWSALWKSSGKSPPSHSGNKCHHHQRHSHPPNSKNSSTPSKHKGSSNSSSPSSSSTSSSKSSSTGLLGGGSSNNKISFSEKLHTFFSEKTHAPQIADQGKGSPDSASTGIFSRFKDDSKRSRGNSKSGKSSVEAEEHGDLRSSLQSQLCVMVSKQSRSVTMTNPNGAGTTSKSTVTSCTLATEHSSHPQISSPPTLTSYYSATSSQSHQSETWTGRGPSESQALYSNSSPLVSNSPLGQSRSSPRRDCPVTTMVSTSDNNGNARVRPASSLLPSPGGPSNTNPTSSGPTEDYTSLVERDIVYEQDSSISQRMRSENSESQMSLEDGEELPDSLRTSRTMMVDSQEELFSRDEDSNP